MKWKKVISGALAAALVITSVVSTPLTVSAAGGTISVSEILYTAPAVNEQPRQVTAEIDAHHDEVTDRSEKPASMEAVGSSTVEIQKPQNTGTWGFNQQLKTSDAKFNIRGDAQMLVSFRMYLAKRPEGDTVCSVISKGDQYGIQLANSGLRLFMQNEQGTVRTLSFDSCFTGGTGRWYDVIAVIDARNASRSRIYEDGQASQMLEHRNVNSTSDPFAIGCKVKGDTVSETFAKEYGYLADVKFYNSRELSADDNAAFRQTLNLVALNRTSDKGWSAVRGLTENIKPTALFSLKPYDMETIWTVDGKPVEDVFRCGNAYTATTTFRAHDSYDFSGNTGDSIKFTDDYAYEKIALTESNGQADCEEKSGESGGNQGLGKFAVDGDSSTYWHTQYKNPDTGAADNNVNLSAGQNNKYTITLSDKTKIGQFGYLPRQAGAGVVVNGTIFDYSLWYKENTSDSEWQPLITDGRWASNTEKKYVDFDPVEASAIQIRVTRASGGNFITAAEFEVYEAVPQTNGTVNVTLSNENKTMTVVNAYGELECIQQLDHVSFEGRAVLENGQTHTISPSVYATDGRLVEEHKKLLEESKNIVYTYEAKAEDGESSTDVITVSGKGVITANKEGSAIVKATAKIGERVYGSRNILVTVLEQNRMLYAPRVTYISPQEGAYPRVADAKLQRTDLNTDMILDVSEGGSALELIEGAEAPVIENKDGIVGFAARYQATQADQQFNVTGSNPMVITMKLFLKQLPQDNAEHTILSKGNQYNFVVMKNPGNRSESILRFQISGGNWSAWKYVIDDSFLNKWHDIVIVADGKGNENSVGFFVDREYRGGNVGRMQGSGAATISEKDGGTAEGTLRHFAIGDKTGESNPMKFTSDDGLMAGIRFYNINQVNPLLADKINLSAFDSLGQENDKAAVVIQNLVEGEKPTAHITATPYNMSTKWYVLDEEGGETLLDGSTPFTNLDIIRHGYSVRTTFQAYEGFAFDSTINAAKVKEQLTIDPEVPDELYECAAGVRNNGRELEVRVTFQPKAIPAQDFTYASPAADRTTRRQPRYDEEAVGKYMTVADTKWLTNGETEITDPAFTFTQITNSNWYRAESVLTAKDPYQFDNSADYKEDVKKKIKTQVFGNVAADVNVAVSDDCKTMTIQLDYTTPIYQVTFDLNGGSGTVNPQSVSEGNTAVEPENVPQREGYTFGGWHVQGSQTAYDFTAAVTADVQLQAKWNPIYNVTFHPELEGMEDIVRTVGADGKIIAIGVTTEKKIKFEGWFEKEADGSWKNNAFDFDTIVAKDMELYAKWSATVTFVDSGEADADVIKEVKAEYGKTVAESEIPSPGTKEGYEFKNWYLKTGETETEYTKDTVINEHTTVYAKWEKKTYTVTYELNGGDWKDGETAPSTIKHGEILAYTEPVREEYNFAGWYTDSACTDDARYTFAPAADNITLYAKWTTEETFTVTYNAKTEGAEITPASVRIVKDGKVMAAPRAVKEHWEVEGWYTDEALTQKFTFGAEGTAITADITLYAKWQRKQYTVTYEANEGSAVAAVTVESESVIAEAPVSEKEGYTLEGWYRNASLTRKFEFGTDKVLGDMTLYARWIIPVTSVTITPNPVEMKVGEDPRQLRAAVLPDNATDKERITWESEDEMVATVDSNGFVTAVGEGETNITAAAGGITGKTVIKVTQDESAVKTRKLLAEQDFGIKSWSTDRNTSYTNRKILVVRNERTDNDRFGSVGEGMLESGQAGNDSAISLLQFDISKITRADKNALKKATLRLCLAGGRNASTDNHLAAAVVPAESGLTDLTGKTTWNAVSQTVTDWLSDSANRFAKAGESDVYSDNGGKNMDSAAPLNPAVYVRVDMTDAVKNASSRKLILAINETKGAEQYFVRTSGAVGDNKFANATEDMAPTLLFTYEGDEAETVTVTPNEKTLTSPGETIQLNAEVGPGSAVDKTVTWSSSNEDVATVDAAGLVTAVSNGTATITATANGAGENDVKGTAVIKVAIPCACEIGGLKVAGGTTIRIRSSESSGSLQLSALAAVNGTCPITGHPEENDVTYTYEIKSDAVNTAGASVDETTGLVTATKGGSVEVTVNAALADGAEGKTTAQTTVTITVRKLEEGIFAVDYHANTNGHDAEVTDMPEGTEAESGTKLEKPAVTPSWAGHTFQGWSTSADGSVVSWPYEITDDVDFYAVWEEAGSITDAEAKALLERAIAEAKEYYEGMNIYTDGTWNPFKEAYEAATGNTEGLTPAQIRNLADALTEAVRNLAVDQDKLVNAVTDLLAGTKAEIDGGNTQYTEDAWSNYVNAYNELKKAAEEGADADTLLRLYRSLVGEKGNLKLNIDKDWTNAKAALLAALKEADAIRAAGKAQYDAGKWDAFIKAYDAANAKKNAKVGDATAAELQALAKALSAAIKDVASLQKGDFIEQNGIRYVVTDAAAKKVSAEGILAQKKKLKKAVILPNVTIKKVNCTVTEVKEKGFANFKNLKNVTIGANIELVGKQAFKGCKKLAKVSFKGKKVPVMKGKAFKGTSSKMKVKLSKALKKGKNKKAMIKKLKKAGVSKKAKIS